MTKQKPTRESIIKAWKETDAKSEKPVGAKQVAEAMHISPFDIEAFAGRSLTDMKLKHGIRLSHQEKHLSDDELFSMLDKVMSEHHGILGWNLLHEKTGIHEHMEKKPGRSTRDVRNRTSTRNTLIGYKSRNLSRRI